MPLFKLKMVVMFASFQAEGRVLLSNDCWESEARIEANSDADPKNTSRNLIRPASFARSNRLELFLNTTGVESNVRNIAVGRFRK